MTTRFENAGENLVSIYSFANEFLIRCPRCSHDARVFRVENEQAEYFRRRGFTIYARVSCLHCGFSQDKAFNGYVIGTPTDCYFQFPLWFQMPCCGQTLWAYNRRHLAYLERYVEAELREEGPPGNRGLASKLPKWMKTAKNRDEVLKCIDRLKAL